MMKLGKVKDFEVDSKKLQITHLILELEDTVAEKIFGKSPRIGHAKGRFTTSIIETFKDAIILNKPTAELKGDIKRL